MSRLLFVYNAFSGTHNKVLDGLLKAVSPKSYTCNLCKLTYGNFSEKKAWKSFRKNSEIEMEFLHIDEFRKQYASKFGHKYVFPIVLYADERDLEIFISNEELEAMRSLEELIALVEKRSQGLF